MIEIQFLILPSKLCNKYLSEAIKEDNVLSVVVNQDKCSGEHVPGERRSDIVMLDAD